MTLEEFIQKDEKLARAVASRRLEEIEMLFYLAIVRYIKVYKTYHWIYSLEHTIENDPKLKQEVDKITETLAIDVTNAIQRATKEQWIKAQNTAIKFAETYFDVQKLKSVTQKIFNALQLNEYKLFQNGKLGDYSLSNRVWKYTKQFEGQMADAITIALKNGDSSQDLSRDIKKYLNNPDALFRRVRDEKGQLHLSKNAQLYHPGQGVYRSAHKNAMRLARTEINRAYKLSENKRWASLDFVIGFEIKLSNNHTLNGRPFIDVCDELKGKYPKSFQFYGWHPSCRCFQIPILKPMEIFTDELKQAVKEDYSHLGISKKKLPQCLLISQIT